MIHIGTWFWGDKYPRHYVDRLKAGVERHLEQPFIWHEWRPIEEDIHLTKVPGCLVRLRTFDPIWQQEQGVCAGDVVVCLDLDLIVTGNLNGLFDQVSGFSILTGVNSINPCPYNGSLWCLRSGYRPDVWQDFSLDAVNRVPWYAFPDDQSWFAAKMPDAGSFGPAQGVYAFGKPGWPKGTALPKDARIVAFPGHRDPSQFAHLDWVRRHWH